MSQCTRFPNPPSLATYCVYLELRPLPSTGLPDFSGTTNLSVTPPSPISLPRYGGRVGLHIDLFGACSAFTRVAACTLARSPIVAATRRLQTFRCLHACSGCFRLERFRRVGLAPTGKRRLLTAHADSSRLLSREQSAGFGTKAGID